MSTFSSLLYSHSLFSLTFNEGVSIEYLRKCCWFWEKIISLHLHRVFEKKRKLKVRRVGRIISQGVQSLWLLFFLLREEILRSDYYCLPRPSFLSPFLQLLLLWSTTSDVPSVLLKWCWWSLVWPSLSCVSPSWLFLGLNGLFLFFAGEENYRVLQIRLRSFSRTLSFFLVYDREVHLGNKKSRKREIKTHTFEGGVKTEEGSWSIPSSLPPKRQTDFFFFSVKEQS
jgi:hypothetical protein